MANFIKLTVGKCDSIWLNMDMVEQFEFGKDDQGSKIYLRPITPDDAPLIHVKERPEAIMELLIQARKNQGYGFGEAA